METVDKGTRKLNPGYEVPIPWKPDQPQLNNNRQVALQRLNGLLKKFTREPEYEKEYRVAVRKNLDEEYARKITESAELDHPSNGSCLIMEFITSLQKGKNFG